MCYILLNIDVLLFFGIADFILQMYLEGGSAVEQNNETAFQYFTKAVEQVCGYASKNPTLLHLVNLQAGVYSQCFW